MLPKSRRGQCLQIVGGHEGRLSPCWVDPMASCPTQPHPISPHSRAPPRIDRPVMCPCFGFDWCSLIQQVIMHLSNPKPGHTTGGSSRRARQSGQAGSGKIACQQKYSPRKQKSTVPTKAWKKRRFNVSPEARTSEFLFKPTEEPNERLTVYHRFITFS